jgi:hypothetical protein
MKTKVIGGVINDSPKAKRALEAILEARFSLIIFLSLKSRLLQQPH